MRNWLGKIKRVRWAAGSVMLALIAVSIAATGCGGGSSTTITEGGSTTVQPVAEMLAAAFMADNPDVKIIIQGGGSSTGVSKTADGTFDIGAASRELKSSEPALVTHLLARDGIAIITNTGNSVSGLTKDQVMQIYAGTITNWNEVGGPDEDIIVISREEGSGTRDAFQELVMGEELIKSGAILQPSNGTIKTATSSTPYSIGYLSFGYIDSAVKALAVDGVAGTVDNVLNGTYPISRPLYFLTLEQPTGAVADFIDFCLGVEGQDIVEDEGYISAQ
ncbi:MAG: phosphate ABC transporter substrate-binding protein [Dehalococcoidia bacterium]